MKKGIITLYEYSMIAIITNKNGRESQIQKNNGLLLLLICSYNKNLGLMSTLSRKNKTTQPVFKLVLLGDPATGKSSLMQRFVKDEFSQNYQNTIGTQFVTKKVNIDFNTEIKIQIWDTAGQQTFRSIIKAFFRNSSAILLVYNITDVKSLDGLLQWKKLAQESAPTTSLFVLVGTHLDKEQKREVSRDEATKWMQSNQMDFFFEASAKTSQNVHKVFEQVGKRIFSKWLSQRKPKQIQSQVESVSMKLQSKKVQTNQSPCC